MPGLGWWPWSSCAKFKWSGSKAIMVSDDLLLSSHTIGWVSFLLFMAFGYTEISLSLLLRNVLNNLLFHHTKMIVYASVMCQIVCV